MRPAPFWHATTSGVLSNRSRQSGSIPRLKSFRASSYVPLRTCLKSAGNIRRRRRRPRRRRRRRRLFPTRLVVEGIAKDRRPGPYPRVRSRRIAPRVSEARRRDRRRRREAALAPARRFRRRDDRDGRHGLTEGRDRRRGGRDATVSNRRHSRSRRRRRRRRRAPRRFRFRGEGRTTPPSRRAASDSRGVRASAVRETRGVSRRRREIVPPNSRRRSFSENARHRGVRLCEPGLIGTGSFRRMVRRLRRRRPSSGSEREDTHPCPCPEATRPRPASTLAEYSPSPEATRPRPASTPFAAFPGGDSGNPTRLDSRSDPSLVCSCTRPPVRASSGAAPRLSPRVGNLGADRARPAARDRRRRPWFANPTAAPSPRAHARHCVRRRARAHSANHRADSPRRPRGRRFVFVRARFPEGRARVRTLSRTLAGTLRQLRPNPPTARGEHRSSRYRTAGGAREYARRDRYRRVRRRRRPIRIRTRPPAMARRRASATRSSSRFRSAVDDGGGRRFDVPAIAIAAAIRLSAAWRAEAPKRPPRAEETVVRGDVAARVTPAVEAVRPRRA